MKAGKSTVSKLQQYEFRQGFGICSIAEFKVYVLRAMSEAEGSFVDLLGDVWGPLQYTHGICCEISVSLPSVPLEHNYNWSRKGCLAFGAPGQLGTDRDLVTYSDRLTAPSRRCRSISTGVRR